MKKKLSAGIVVSLTCALLAPGAAHAARSVTITGGGWGHGIGMSQYGAYGRAVNGRSAPEIIKHYYSGATVATKRMPKVRVGLHQQRNQLTFTSSPYLGGSGKVVWKVAGSKGVVAQGPSGTKWRVEPSAAGGMRLYKNDNQVTHNGAGVIGTTSKPLVLVYQRFGSLVSVGGKSYNYALGKLQIGSYATTSCTSGFCLRLVVVLPMQKYLFGLAEVPSSWPGAVLRTQAIAGRTYAYEKHTRLGSRRYPCDCTVYDSVADQAYAGDGKRTGSGTYWQAWKSAVKDTNNQIINYGGKPIQALYSSSSGGHTENNSNVWGGTQLPYLKGVRDKPDAVSANPNHKWDPYTIGYAEFEKKLDNAYGIGSLQEFGFVAPRGVSGRVTVVKSPDSGGLRIVGSNKTVRVSGWDFRTKFGSNVIKDTLFYVDIKQDVGEKFVSAYKKLNGAPGDPKSSTYPVPRGTTPALGRAQDFQKGRMTWRKETDKVVWQYGRVLKAYDGYGRERSILGMPTSGIWGKAGKFRGGSYVNGVVIWSKGNGVHNIRGPWFTAFRGVGGQQTMGFPTNGIKTTSAGGARQRLTKGTLYRPPGAPDVYALWGEIDVKYRQLGGGGSKCGYPTGSMVADPAGAAAAFERGSIVWTSESGVRVHCG